MRKIFNNRAETLKRQQLRAEMPASERLGWKQLRGEALGVKFRRQVSIGKYVVDLYCPSLHLAIEVDGESHAGKAAQKYDKLRQSEIESLGARFMRVSNEDVYRSALDVAEGIALVVAEIEARLNRRIVILRLFEEHLCQQFAMR